MDNNNNNNGNSNFPKQNNFYISPQFDPFAPVAPQATFSPQPRPQPMYPVRLKTSEEVAREIEDAKFAQRLAEEEHNTNVNKPSVKQDEEFAKKLIYEENLKILEQRKLRELENEAAALRIQQDEDRLRQSTLLQQEESRKRQEQDSIRRIQQQEEDKMRQSRLLQQSDAEFAAALIREEEKEIQIKKDIAVARRLQAEEDRAMEAERRRLAQEEQRRADERRRMLENERRIIQEEERRRIAEERRRIQEEERRRADQIIADAALAANLSTLSIHQQPSNYVNYHTLLIHSNHCGCAKHNTWNNNHVMKIHRKYCNCPHPHQGEQTNEGLFHTHGISCSIYCKYNNHIHTHECCRKNHTHSARCHCAAKFL